MLLESLVACFGVTIRAVSTSMGIPIASGSITAAGDLDFRGTLGVKANDGGTVAVGFQNITLTVSLEVANEHKQSLEKLISLSERYCVVLQTLKTGVNIGTRLGQADDKAQEARSHTEGLNGKNDKNSDSIEPVVSDEDVLRLN